MKKLIFTLAFFIAYLSANAQINKDTVGLHIPVVNKNVVYTEVVTVNGLTKDELYRNAQQWFINYFDGTAKFTQGADKNGSYIIGRGVLKFTSGLRLDANVLWGDDALIKIECKDNKYRYTFYGLVIKDITDNAEYEAEQVLGAVLGTQKWPWSKNAAKNVLINNNQKLQTAIAFLKADMQTPTTDF